MIRRVCVFCGSRPGTDPQYAAVMKRLAACLVERGCHAVYGGGRAGLMGVLADEMMRLGGQVIGVIPEHLAAIELTHPDVPDMRVVGSMHERKALMLELSDAFIALPGGFGTMEELFEVVSWRQMGLHPHPVGLLNTGGFYDHLQQFVRTMATAEFLYPNHVDSLIIDTDPEKLMDRLEQSLS